MLQLFLSGIIKPLAFPAYCLCGLTLAGVFLWSVWTAGKDGVARLRRLHQIPCDRCVFFTGDYRLKCTVHPVKALTEDAINCTDYESTTAPATVYSKWCQQFGWSMPKTTSICDCSTRGS